MPLGWRVGRALTIPSGWEPVTPLHTLGSRWTRSLQGSHTSPTPVDPWIEQPCCGDPVCMLVQPLCRRARPLVFLVGNPQKGGPPALRMPGPWPPGWTSAVCQSHTHAPLMAPHGFWTDLSFCFEHYQDNLSCVLGDPRAPDGLTPGMGSPLHQQGPAPS